MSLCTFGLRFFPLRRSRPGRRARFGLSQPERDLLFRVLPSAERKNVRAMSKVETLPSRMDQKVKRTSDAPALAGEGREKEWQRPVQRVLAWHPPAGSKTPTMILMPIAAERDRRYPPARHERQTAMRLKRPPASVPDGPQSVHRPTSRPPVPPRVSSTVMRVPATTGFPIITFGSEVIVAVGMVDVL